MAGRRRQGLPHHAALDGIGAETGARRRRPGRAPLLLAARSRDCLATLSESSRRPTPSTSACDVEGLGEQERLAAAYRRFGRIDVVFASRLRRRARLPRGTPEHWRDMVLTNVLGVAYTIRATLPAVKDARGHFLLTSSVAGRRALPGLAVLDKKHAVGDGRGPAPGRQRHRRAGHADRARHGRHAVLRQPRAARWRPRTSREP